MAPAHPLGRLLGLDQQKKTGFCYRHVSLSGLVTPSCPPHPLWPLRGSIPPWEAHSQPSAVLSLLTGLEAPSYPRTAEAGQWSVMSTGTGTPSKQGGEGQILAPGFGGFFVFQLGTQNKLGAKGKGIYREGVHEAREPR